MNRLIVMMLGVIILGLVVLTSTASACPMCKEAIQASSDGNNTLTPEEQEGVQMAKAYNNSIYMFVAMPYLLVGGVGFLVYRSYKNKLKLAQNNEPEVQNNEPEA